MDDVISRQAAIDGIDKLMEIHFDRKIVLNKAKNIVEQLPSVQPEIIRCKECLMHGVCRFEQGLGLDGYCSQAKRRTDE